MKAEDKTEKVLDQWMRLNYPSLYVAIRKKKLAFDKDTLFRIMEEYSQSQAEQSGVVDEDVYVKSDVATGVLAVSLHHSMGSVGFDTQYLKKVKLSPAPVTVDKDSAEDGSWISMENKMPSGRCLLRTTSNIIVVGDRYKGLWRVDGGVRWKSRESGNMRVVNRYRVLVSDYKDEDITHWHPLPELAAGLTEPPKTK